LAGVTINPTWMGWGWGIKKPPLIFQIILPELAP
jgi:hypothetical protein